MNFPCYIFDFDDTLIETSAKVLIRDKNLNDIVVMTLSTSAFNNLNNNILHENQYIDFSNFHDFNILMNEKPTNILNILHSFVNCNYDCFILTSRQHAEDIQKYLEHHKIYIPLKNIICTNAKGSNFSGNDSNRKLQALQNLAKQRYNIFHIWEDSKLFKETMNKITEYEKNIKIFFHKV